MFGAGAVGQANVAGRAIRLLDTLGITLAGEQAGDGDKGNGEQVAQCHILSGISAA